MITPLTLNTVSDFQDFVSNHPDEFIKIESPASTKLKNAVAYRFKEHQAVVFGEKAGKVTAEICIINERFCTGPATGSRPFFPGILKTLIDRDKLVTDDIARGGSGSDGSTEVVPVLIGTEAVTGKAKRKDGVDVMVMRHMSDGTTFVQLGCRVPTHLAKTIEGILKGNGGISAN